MHHIPERIIEYFNGMHPEVDAMAALRHAAKARAEILVYLDFLGALEKQEQQNKKNAVDSVATRVDFALVATLSS